MSDPKDECIEMDLESINQVQNTITLLWSHLHAIEKELPTIRKALRALTPSEGEPVLRKLTAIYGPEPVTTNSGN